MVDLAKKLKKNGVSVDIINFGEADLNREKLEAFMAAINNKDNSHLVNIPPGPYVLSDVLVSSPILAAGNLTPRLNPLTSSDMTFPTGTTGESSGAPTGEFGGIDPNLDPELAMAIKLSMEEERARLGKEGGSTSKAPAPQPMTMDTEDADLMQALQMSMQSQQTSGSSQPAPSAPAPEVVPMDDDEEMRLALQMSMQGTMPEPKNEGEEMKAKLMEDPEFLKNVLMGLPGVDPNSEAMQKLLKKDQEKKDEKKEPPQ
jgi:26S proteasome regulatory subunit N10